MKHPSLGGGGAPPAMYTKQVLSDFSKIETLLKMVGTPKEILVDVFKRQWSEGTAKDLQVVCGLKGMKRVEQTSILENFGGFLSGGGSSSSGMSGAAASSSGGFSGEQAGEVMNSAVEKFTKGWR